RSRSKRLKLKSSADKYLVKFRAGIDTHEFLNKFDFLKHFARLTISVSLSLIFENLYKLNFRLYDMGIAIDAFRWSNKSSRSFCSKCGLIAFFHLILLMAKRVLLKNLNSASCSLLITKNVATF